jgi:hypothetical protein
LIGARTGIDAALERLREAVAMGDPVEIGLHAEEVRRIARDFETDVQNARVASRDPEREARALEDLAHVANDVFWEGLTTRPEETLFFLESRIAPLASDGRSLYLRLLGTDLSRYPEAFDRFRLVTGKLPPEGAPGLLLSRQFYEREMKHEVARAFDRIQVARAQGRRFTEDALLREEASRLAGLWRSLLLEIPPTRAEAVRTALGGALGPPEAPLEALIQALLEVDDASFEARRDLFQGIVAPEIRLYLVLEGETVTLRSFTRSGYARAALVPLYGVFEFQGLESSDLAGANQLVDLETLRTLIGRMSEAQKAELADIRVSVGVSELSREDAEAALFGSAPGASDLSRAGAPKEVPLGDEGSLVLNAAVLLRDGARPDVVLRALNAAFEARALRVEAIGWRQAAGLVGQLVTVIQAVLYTGIFLILLVALAIINNTMMMSAMQRRAEIGTLRAIGTQRSQILTMFLVETLLLGILASGLGALAGAGVVLLLGRVGIPAVADVLVLLFAGPRLYPSLDPLLLPVAVGLVLVFALLSALQPTLLAARVSPVVAMAQKE